MRVHSLNLPEDIKNIEILPLSDLHVGDASFNRECFLRYIRCVAAHLSEYGQAEHLTSSWLLIGRFYHFGNVTDMLSVS